MARLHGFRENARTQVFSRKTTRFPGANETELLRKEGTAALCAWRGRKSTSHAHLIPHTCPGAAFHWDDADQWALIQFLMYWFVTAESRFPAFGLWLCLSKYMFRMPSKSDLAFSSRNWTIWPSW